MRPPIRITCKDVNKYDLPDITDMAKSTVKCQNTTCLIKYDHSLKAAVQWLRLEIKICQSSMTSHAIAISIHAQLHEAINYFVNRTPTRERVKDGFGVGFFSATFSSHSPPTAPPSDTPLRRPPQMPDPRHHLPSHFRLPSSHTHVCLVTKSSSEQYFPSSCISPCCYCICSDDATQPRRSE